MKKVCIVTECNKYVTNFGETLQAVALNRVISSLGFDTVTLSPDSEELIFEIGDMIRGFRFESFRKKSIKNPIIRTNDFEQMEKVASGVDYLVCGSDCIWNEVSVKDFYFLNFNTNAKKIAYAPSLRDSVVISARYKKYIKNWVKDFTCLSTREREGSRLISELTGRDCDTVIDPTLLISSENWKKMSGTKGKIRQKYILVYLIGKKDIAKEYFAEMKGRFKSDSLIFIDEDNNLWDDGKLVKTNGPIGPAEFITLICNAEAVITDSFHGTVFSINFGKPFLSFQRIGNKKTMYDYDCRIPNILSVLGIEGHFVSRKGQNVLWKDIDYHAVNEKLEQERNHAIMYLKKALDL